MAQDKVKKVPLEDNPYISYDSRLALDIVHAYADEDGFTAEECAALGIEGRCDDIIDAIADGVINTRDRYKLANHHDLPSPFIWSLAGNSEGSRPVQRRIKALVAKLENTTDRMQRYRIMKAFEEIGPAAKPALMKMLEGEDSDIRYRAACVLSTMFGGGTPAVVDTLIERLEAGKYGALDSIANLGPNAAKAAPHVIAALEDGLASAREYRKWDKKPDILNLVIPVAFVKSHKMKVHGHGRRIAVAALEALKEIGPEAGEAVPIIMRAIHFGDREIRVAAIEALGGIGAPANDAVSKIVDLLCDEHEGMKIRIAAAGALKHIADSDDERAVAALTLYSIPGEKSKLRFVRDEQVKLERAARQALYAVKMK